MSTAEISSPPDALVAKASQAGPIYATGSYGAAFQLQMAELVLAAVIRLFLRVPEIEPGTARGAAFTSDSSAN